MSSANLQMSLPQRASKFSLSHRWTYREGCGYGVHQSHIVGTLECQSDSSPFALPWKSVFAELLDEPLMELPSHPRIEEVAKWLTVAIGALLRGAGIATARDARIESVSAADQHQQRCAMVIPVSSPRTSMMCMQWLINCVNTPFEDEKQMRQSFFELMKSLKQHARQSANHWRTLQAAYDDRYPVLPLTSGIASIGSGVYRRWFDSFITDRTPFLAMQLAQDKHRTAALLRSHGFPGAVNRRVDTLEQARQAAKELGYPVVVKPNDRDRGLGVSADIVSDADLAIAFESAVRHSRRVLVEKFQPGFTHRFSVVEGKVLRVAKHVAFGVVGDGRSNIAQLVAIKARTIEQQKRVLRSGVDSCVLDDEAISLLRQNGRNPQTVPGLGEYVRLRRKDNISAGGHRFTLNIDHDVHDDNIALALHVSELLGLDFAGVDLISPDISRSWREMPATICEINGCPQLVALDDPQMYKRVLRHVMPAPFRVESVLVLMLAAPDEALAARLVKQFCSARVGYGLSMAKGVWVDEKLVSGPFDNGYKAAVALCVNANVRKATFVMTVAEVLRHGVPLGVIDSVFLPDLQKEKVDEARHRDYWRALTLLRPHIKATSPQGK